MTNDKITRFVGRLQQDQTAVNGKKRIVLGKKNEMSTEPKQNVQSTIDTALEVVPENNKYLLSDSGILSEKEANRTIDSATYLRNNRTTRKVISSTPVFYANEKTGKLEEIKNTLKDDGDFITNEKSQYQIKFDKRHTQGKIFDIQKNSHAISLYSEGFANHCTCSLCAEDNSVTLKNGAGEEIQYIAYNDRLKENIIVKSAQEKYEYDFKLNIGNLAVEEGASGNLLLKNESGETEFIIPAPYMYDASGKTSDDVSYKVEVECETLFIHVTASAKFINSPDIQFPVTIDPQIIITSSDIIECEYYYSDNGESADDPQPTYGKLQVSEAYYAHAASEYGYIYIHKDKIEKYIKNLISVKLQVTSEKASGLITINGQTFDGMPEHTYEVNITDAFSKAEKVLSIYFGAIANSTVRSSSAEYYTTGENAPKLIIDYMEDVTEYSDDAKPNIKEFALGDKSVGYVDLQTGVLTSAVSTFAADDFVLPINIAHLHRLGNNEDGTSGYGENWRLNLNKKLRRSVNDTEHDTVYTYLDEYGNYYTFKEIYYYLNSGEKKFVPKDDVNIDLDGNLTYENKKVYKHYSCNGYTLIPEIDDYINSEFIEQRQEEQIQLEDYIKACEESLADYMVIEDKSGKKIMDMYSFDTDRLEQLIELAKENKKYILATRGEAVQLKGVYSELNDLYKAESDYLDEIAELNQYIQATTKELNDLGTHPSVLEKQAELEEAIAQAKEKIAKDYEELAKTLEIMELKTEIRDIYLSQVSANLEKIEEYYAKYKQYKAELARLVKQTPVNFVQDSNGIISGFNKDGYLVGMYDIYENYVTIEYDESYRIAGIYDSNGKAMDFVYNSNLLQSITDSLGRTVKYEYDQSAKKLTRVIFADGSTLDFEYQSDRMRKITSSNRVSAKINHKDGKLDNIVIYRQNKTFAKGMSEEEESEKTVSKVVLAYNGNTTTITNDDNSGESYTINANGKVTQYTQTDNCGRYATTTYKYTEVGGGKRTDFTTESNVTAEIIEGYETRDKFDLVTFKDSGWTYITENTQVNTQTTCNYDVNNRLIQEIIVKSIKNDDSTIAKTNYINYNYNAQGKLVSTESYVAGEELTTGKTVEERVYDTKGNCVKTITWNTLDSSGKFYSESVYADNGQLISEKDETGENSAEYEYKAGTNTVNSVTYPNGSRFAYGRNAFNGEVTSITQSTESGEANTTDILRVCGMPVEVKSGNTAINYSYDYKGRKTSVTINDSKHADYSYTDYKYDDETQSASFGSQTQKIYVDSSETVTIVTKKDGSPAKDGAQQTTETTTINKTTVYIKSANAKGLVTEVTNRILNGDSVYKTAYEYDAYNNLTQVQTVADGQDEILTETYEYNLYGDISYRQICCDSLSHVYEYVYSDDSAKKLTQINFANYSVYPLTDAYGRNTGREVYSGATKIAGEYISYRKVGDHATNMPSTVYFANGSTIQDNIKYKYDKSGNISEIYENGQLKARYLYDSLNRLIREDNKAFGETSVYDYDSNGNILNKSVTKLTLKPSINQEELQELNYYGYNGDRLVSYNGEDFEYNNVGSPTVYRGHSLSWLYGKLLSSFNSTTFTYDAQGRRVSKDDTQFRYDAEGNLVKQFTGDPFGMHPGGRYEVPERGEGSVIEYVYDNTGLLLLNYNGVIYYYRKDAQGNVIALLDRTGKPVAYYEYDAWGNHIVFDSNGDRVTDPAFIGNVNPFRYRGYYYDTETGLYYLQSRYYDPETGRFISQDSIEYADPETINGLNLYAYCGNNPVMAVDPTGRFVITLTTLVVAAVIGAVVGAVIGGVSGAVVASSNEQDVLTGFLAGMVGGAIMGAGAGIAGLFLAPVLAGVSVTIGLTSASVGLSISTGTALLIGSGVAISSGIIGGGVMEYITQERDTGGIYSWKKVAFSAAEYGLINFVGSFAGAGAEALSLGSVLMFLPVVEGSINATWASIWSSSIGSIIDYLKNYYNLIR